MCYWSAGLHRGDVPEEDALSDQACVLLFSMDDPFALTFGSLEDGIHSAPLGSARLASTTDERARPDEDHS